MTPQLRTFLTVIDESAEMLIALRYAAWRAKHAEGRVALLYVIESHEVQPWRGVEKIMRDDAVAAAKSVLHQHEEFVRQMTGHEPILHIRHGDRREQLLQLLEEHPDISILVLGAHTGPKGPGPLVTYLTSATGIRKLQIPLVIVPDTYKMEADNLLV